MTLMFTHKATGAWDALTKGLIEAGFAITASWPINTEAEGSLHIKDKAAERVGEATSAVTPWPHQVRAFERLYRDWPPKLLIADEVGLGKTIQAGMLLRQAWLAGRVKRILILAPKAVLKQWQIELREKFNLNWPIYDGRKLVWYPSPAWRGENERVVDRHQWHHEPVVIASSHLMRRRDRAAALLEEAEPWDLVVLDEAHHARRRAAGGYRSERGHRRSHPGEPAAQKKHDRGWGRPRMRYPASEKLEIIRLVEQSHLPINRTLDKLGITRSKFYRWYDLYCRFGEAGLKDRRAGPSRIWNRIPDDVRAQIIEMALERPELSPRELAVTFTDERAYFVSEASVYRLLKAQNLITSPAFTVIKAADAFKDQTTAPNQLWQTDFTYLKVIGWGWFYLSTILDDFSRYIIAWKLCTTMKAEDVTETLEMALEASGLSAATIAYKLRLLSDNGSSYIAGDLAEWLHDHGISHVRGAPNHPQTQGKIERWHQTLKNRLLLEHYYLPGNLEAQIEAFVAHYNHRRYHESLANLTPADVYFGRGQTILLEREKIKRKTIQQRRLQHAKAAA